jgi:hypothetical protein
MYSPRRDGMITPAIVVDLGFTFIRIKVARVGSR